MSKKSFFKLVWILLLQTLEMLYHLVVAPFAIMYVVMYEYIVEIKITININTMTISNIIGYIGCASCIIGIIIIIIRMIMDCNSYNHIDAPNVPKPKLPKLKNKKLKDYVTERR